MANPKVLVTAGCSFTQVPNIDVSWPVPLQVFLQAEQVLFLGQGAAGNGIISRRVIHHVSKLLKFYKPEDILVGIMWSSRNRFEVYSETDIPHKVLSHSPRYTNPVEVAGERNYYLINDHWDDHTTTTFFKNFHSEAYATIITLEHILRTQWFLQQNKINYFMCQYHWDVLPNPKYLPADKLLVDNVDIKNLMNLIDFNNWIYKDRNFNDLYTFAKESGVPFARPPDPHPSTEQHELFVKQVVIPYLIDKKFFIHPRD